VQTGREVEMAEQLDSAHCQGDGWGAACFLACAFDTLQTNRASKMPIRHRLQRFEHELDVDFGDKP
jgi:hypothetical protein